MDLGGFDATFQAPVTQTQATHPTQDNAAWLLIDAWFVKASRSARWMDLLGDYAGSEHFVIDGDALFQIILDDPLLAIGRNARSFQILHAYHSLERALQDFERRHANFEIAFWDDNKVISIQVEGNDFAVASRALARSLLFQHLLKLPFGVHVFDNLDDPEWIQYAFQKKPMFVMSNDGSFEGASVKSPTIFSQRAFLMSVLARGISVTLLKGAEYRDSKILSFVYEPLMGTDSRLASLQPAIRSNRTSLRTEFSLKLGGVDCHLRIHEATLDNDDASIVKLFRELDILAPTQRQVPAEVVYLFLVHILLVPSLSISQRAQSQRVFPLELEDVLQRELLIPVFIKLAKFIASRKYVIALDGTIFSTLVWLALSHPQDVEMMFGDMLRQGAQDIWRSLGGPALNFEQFASRYPLPPDHRCSPTRPELKESEPLLPFKNDIFKEEFSIFDHPDLETEANPPSPPEDRSKTWTDSQHWHNQKSILPRHLGGLAPAEPDDPKKRWRRLRSDQRFMANLQDQAATLTGAAGAVLQQMVISRVTTNKQLSAERRKSIGYSAQVTFGAASLSPTDSNSAGISVPKTPKNIEHKNANPKQSKKPPPLTSAERLRLQIMEKKIAVSKTSSEDKWAQHAVAMSKQPLSTRLESIETLFRNTNLSRERHVYAEMQLYRIQLELQMWIEDDTRTFPATRDKYTVSLMRMIQDICRGKVTTASTKKALISVLTVLGFNLYIENLLSGLAVVDHPPSFAFMKLVRSRTQNVLPDYDFMTITEHPVVWQLRLFGDFMDRSMDSSPDGRVAFEPDAWQRRVLDGIDQNKSLLVVAPTSAGKTFISYYAMEKVLRQSDNGILVYVAPTKALVTQIAAEVYARFKKDLNGKSCWAIHTRDFRIHNPQECQILVTVPEMLAIMLFSPSLAKTWTPRIKRIVLDEIHTIGQQEGGAVWEQILLFSPCPIIGLSATIGSPETFSRWLETVQTAHGHDFEFIEHRHRYSHLRKFFYLTDGKGVFESLDEHQITDRIQFMHPITMLLFGASTIPSDLSLEAADTLSLYYALRSVANDIPQNIQELDPTVFFQGSSQLLRQRDILDYEFKLKAVIENLLPTFDARDPTSLLGRVIASLQDQSSSLSDEKVIERTVSSPFAVQNDLLILLSDLHAKNDLPAILFNFDRSNCEILARHITDELEDAEKKWRSSSPAWARKIKEWKAWKTASEARERAMAKVKKQKKDDIRDASDASWHSSFDPDKPSSQFTFIGQSTAYLAAQLDDDIAALKWTSTPAWAFAALRRGVAVHHAGMNKHYRSLIENLFRKGFVRVMIATGTLALGINAPAKTSIFVGDSPFLTALMYRQCAGRAGRRGFDLRGNVIFYGLSLDRVRRLVLSRLPTLGGNFPLTSTTVLRLFNLLHGSDNAQVVVRAIKGVLSLPQITMNTDYGRDQILHHLRFSIEYLRRSSLLSLQGTPIDWAAVAAHLYYTEPSNLALAVLLRSGVLHDICNTDDEQSAKRAFMLVMSNLFGRRYLSKGFAKVDIIEELVAKYPSMIVLPPLPDAAQKVLVAHDEQILNTFHGYASAFSRRLSFFDDTLPLSGLRVGETTDGAGTSPIHCFLEETAIPTMVRSPFVANSGHDESFKSVSELTRTSRAGLNLNYHAIPTMSGFTNGAERSEALEHQLNAYLFDFFIHGQVSTLAAANCIRRGDVWYLLQDFALTLMTVRTALLQLFSKTSESGEPADLSNDMNLEDTNDPEDVDSDNGGDKDSNLGLPRPPGIAPADWRLLVIVHLVCEEFEAKFRAMWA